MKSCELFIHLIHDDHLAEGDDASKMCGESLRNNHILVDNTERGIVTPTDGVHLVSGYCTMKVDFLLMKNETEGDGIGVSFITQQSQDAMSRPIFSSSQV